MGGPKKLWRHGKALRVEKSRGKEFLLVRDSQAPDLADLHAEIMRDIPLKAPIQKTDLAAWHEEDEE